jgi:hypothetical protein
VLFERICRENGITQRLTKPRSPTTTGKIERLHQTLQQELLNVHGPFASIEAAQAALDVWRKEYNTARPHQSLDMAFPSVRFTRAAPGVLGLQVPAELTRTGKPAPAGDDDPDDVPGQSSAVPPDGHIRRLAVCWRWNWTAWCRRRGTCGWQASRSGSGPR